MKRVARVLASFLAMNGGLQPFLLLLPCLSGGPAHVRDRLSSVYTQQMLDRLSLNPFMSNSVTELASRVLQIQSKRVYVDVKQNKRGRFMKISEVRSNVSGFESSPYHVSSIFYNFFLIWCFYL